jgi:3-hydroxyisobutyrate dehydrogenase-like beta-hydroxyacid dehydrogenase
VSARVVGLLHPGEMGSALGTALQAAGNRVLWASDGRSEQTRARAATFEDVMSVSEVARRAEVVLSVVPPHAALDVARSVPSFGGIFVDANAVSPETARRVGAAVERFVDGGIVGGPPAPRLYLSGEDAAEVASVFEGSAVETEVVESASALKCAYAAWTKGTAALLLAIREFARAEGVEAPLVAEWARSLPGLEARLAAAERSADAKGWRWIGEMQEIAAAFAADGLPPGFHEAAAAVFAAQASREASAIEP